MLWSKIEHFWNDRQIYHFIYMLLVMKRPTLNYSTCWVDLCEHNQLMYIFTMSWYFSKFNSCKNSFQRKWNLTIIYNCRRDDLCYDRKKNCTSENRSKHLKSFLDDKSRKRSRSLELWDNDSSIKLHPYKIYKNEIWENKRIRSTRWTRLMNNPALNMIVL